MSLPKQFSSVLNENRCLLLTAIMFPKVCINRGIGENGARGVEMVYSKPIYKCN